MLRLRGFNSLSVTSYLPKGTTERDLFMLRGLPVLELHKTHGEEGPPLGLVEDYVDRSADAPGRMAVVANHMAALVGERFFGGGDGGGEQLMAHYHPIDEEQRARRVPLHELYNLKNHQVEERAAYGLHWLIDLVQPTVIIDHHFNPTGDRYFGIGSRTTPQALAAGYLRDHHIAQMARYSNVRQAFPGYLFTEDDQAKANADYLAKSEEQMRLIARLGREGLLGVFHDEKLLEAMTFYDSVKEVLLYNPRTGEPYTDVLSVIGELEEITSDAQQWGDELQLSAHVREKLRLSPSVTYYRGMWDYDNYSPVLGRQHPAYSDDRLRRMVIGELMVCSDPPQLVNHNGKDYLEFVDNPSSAH